MCKKCLLLFVLLLLSSPALRAQLFPVIEKADSLLAKGFADEALELYKTEHRNHPENTVLFEKMAAAAAKKGKYRAAVLWYDSAMVTSPNQPNLYFGKAKAYYELEQWEDVIRECTVAISWNGLPRYYSLRGSAHRRLNHRGDAIEDLIHAVNNGDREPRLLVECAEMLRDTGDLKQAIKLADMAIQKAPGYAPGYLARATIRMCLLWPDSVCTDMQAAVEAGYRGDPDIPPALCDGDDSLRLVLMADYCSRHHQYAQAIKGYTRLMKKHPASSAYLVNRATSYKLLGQPEKAEADYLAAEQIVRDEDRQALYHNMGLFYDEQGKPGKALEYMNREMALIPPQPAALIVRSKLFFQLKRMPEAIADLDSALLLEPDSKTALAVRAVVYLEMKQYAKAEADAQRLLQTASATGVGQLLMGLALLKQEKSGYCNYFKTARELGLREALPLIRLHCP